MPANSLYKSYLELEPEPIPNLKATHLKVELYYSLGGNKCLYLQRRTQRILSFCFSCFPERKLGNLCSFYWFETVHPSSKATNAKESAGGFKQDERLPPATH